MTLFETVLPLSMLGLLVVILFSGFPVAFCLAGVGLAFTVIGGAFGLFQPAQLFLVVSRIWGSIADNLVLVAIPMFIFMGIMLERSGVARHLLEILSVLLKRVPGGLALAVVLMGTIMAATTGIVGASVVMLTMLALPVMVERGYDKGISAGVIASSGTLGILIPPSIMLVIMGDLLAIPVGDLFTGAVIPGLLLSGLYLVYILFVGLFQPKRMPRPPEADPLPLRDLLLLIFRGFVPPTVLVLLVLGSIIGGFATPTEAAGVGAFGATLLAIYNRTFTLKLLNDVVQATALTNAMIFGIFCGATLFSYVFRELGGDDAIIHVINALGLHDWALLGLLMVVIFLLGFFFDWLEITLIILPVFRPIVMELDFGDAVPKDQILLWFAIAVAVNLQTSYLTPPFGPALFYLRQAGSGFLTLADIYRGIVPFTLLQLTGLALCIAFPALVLWLPTYLGY
ncbi:TRAP transporter large permease [Xanthobacter tagetidis]|jgi:tripartite ATP-independent transporter DctM subunit|uniref:TRAP transporter large permease protein n=1 Tax=Xanthobacter tagetidis TaxID=60216 RepID=A0A3L6ZY34_9HYPH|nr:TRAP transporter large permease subunit [Xanthobacter tagetidis]MBB6310207.1 tripartite ATP-independent transporter DctM subunit [Xanthobacter tagetidis]RLP72829.1 TRAP transporter large permease subunit [Xanthobacter tagetidis]